jgi:protein SCO1/2
MKIRYLPWRALGAAVLLAAVLAASACSGGDNKGSASPVAGATGDYRGPRVTPPFEKPDVTLVDTNGKPYDLKKETEGYVTLLYLGYTHCPDVCPMHMVTLNAVMTKLPKDVTDHIKVVFVTVDPERDTPEALGKWLGGFNPSFIGLSGDMATITAMMATLSMEPPQRQDIGGGNYVVSHAAYVMAFTPDNLAHTVYPLGVTRDDWEHDLTKLVKEGWNPG